MRRKVGRGGSVVCLPTTESLGRGGRGWFGDGPTGGEELAHAGTVVLQVEPDDHDLAANLAGVVQAADGYLVWTLGILADDVVQFVEGQVGLDGHAVTL